MKHGLIFSILISLSLTQPVFSANANETKATLSAYPSTQVPTPAEDAIITQSIEKLYAQSPLLSKLTIKVNTHKGVVTLQGNVDSDSQAALLTEKAQSVVGVSDVNTAHLTVKGSEHPLTDTLITAKIKGLFLREKVFGNKDIAAINLSVETKNGIVYLTGTIDNQDQLHNAIRIIKSIKGVNGVQYSVNKSLPHTTTSSRS